MSGVLPDENPVHVRNRADKKKKRVREEMRERGKRREKMEN